MRIRSVIIGLFILVGVVSILGVRIAHAHPSQAPARGATQAPASGVTPPAARASVAAPARYRIHGTLLQVMRGILFPNSNVIFAAQNDDFTKAKPDADPSLSTNPITSIYGGWTAVENSSLALAESANLLMIPGRVCSNGKPAPIQNADWAKFVQGLREAGMAAYTAAKSKNTEAFLDVSDKMTAACSNCHDVYREKTEKQGGEASRCTK
jgi:hypothetical protein